MSHNYAQDVKQQETGLYDKIRELSERLDRLYKEGKDTTDTIQSLEAVLQDFLLFRQQARQRPEQTQLLVIQPKTDLPSRKSVSLF